MNSGWKEGGIDDHGCIGRMPPKSQFKCGDSARQRQVLEDERAVSLHGLPYGLEHLWHRLLEGRSCYQIACCERDSMEEFATVFEIGS